MSTPTLNFDWNGRSRPQLYLMQAAWRRRFENFVKYPPRQKTGFVQPGRGVGDGLESRWPYHNLAVACEGAASSARRIICRDVQRVASSR